MMRDPRYDVLFEPVKIGPLIAPNRFFQVPHADGMGYAMPRGMAQMREVKAEGGWGVVCTGYCSIHPSSDETPHLTATLWDAEDVRAQALMVEGVHRHGALAGVELWYGGAGGTSYSTRIPPLGVTSVPVAGHQPLQTRAMDARDIRDFRRWHRDAAKRAVEAGFDIVYVYATHGYLLDDFLSRHTNSRSDSYGGRLENRVRLVRELIEETREATEGACAVAVRFRADEGGGEDAKVEHEDRCEMFSLLAELPDLWDINITDWSLELGSSRFVKEAALEDYVAFAKQMTSKPVVGVGRFTSPDTMVRQIEGGLLDMIGAARPSIADPFLPRKIEEGRIDEIRECIGCNICNSQSMLGAPIRCTQNPTMGEEWRRGWHPERVAHKGSEARVLVVGAGPAGLEAAQTLGQRGYPVTLAEASTQLGGRVRDESRLPGHAEWLRVHDWRAHRLDGMPNVQIYRSNLLTAPDVLEYGFEHVAIATGAHWRKDGAGRWHREAIIHRDLPQIFTPDDVISGAKLSGPVVVFDDDRYYMGGLIAEALRGEGLDVALVTPAPQASAWSLYTTEQERTQGRLLELGIDVLTGTTLEDFDGEGVDLACVHTGRKSRRAALSLVLVTARTPNDELYRALTADADALASAGIASVTRIGDCLAPSTIDAAVFSGHGFARELDAPDPGSVPFERERATV
jgi:dimethylamine/trimethylamine dehydrogenase